MELADTSAWVWSRRRSQPALRAEFDEAAVVREIATCDMVRFELQHSARNPREFAEMELELSAIPTCPISAGEWSRALLVYRELAELGAGMHRKVGHQDLLIAAAAESAGITLLHYDADFDLIAEVTGQPTRWLAPKGSLR